MEEIVSKFVGEWGWLTAVAIVTFAFKDLVSNFVIGAQFLYGNDYNIDDISSSSININIFFFNFINKIDDGVKVKN